MKGRKKSKLRSFLRCLSHPWIYIRASAWKELHRRRIIKENIEFDYQLHKEEYDREFERAWRREWREMMEPTTIPTDTVQGQNGMRN